MYIDIFNHMFYKHIFINMMMTKVDTEGLDYKTSSHSVC